MHLNRLLLPDNFGAAAEVDTIRAQQLKQMQSGSSSSVRRAAQCWIAHIGKCRGQ